MYGSYRIIGVLGGLLCFSAVAAYASPAVRPYTPGVVRRADGKIIPVPKTPPLPSLSKSMNRSYHMLSQPKTSPKKETVTLRITPARSPAEQEIVVFANFEDGAYNGWTLQGNCWGAAPMSSGFYGGSIVGYEGSRFLCTLSAQKGYWATGTAISSEFVVTKPYIRFLIGGGSYPQECCLRLVIDNIVIASATGDDTPTLIEKEWNVSDYNGKKAHFEVLDESKSPNRGYIMVDGIEFRDRSINEGK